MTLIAAEWYSHVLNLIVLGLGGQGGELRADGGMTTSQAAFAIGPAADTAKDPTVSDERKSTTVQNTLKK